MFWIAFFFSTVGFYGGVWWWLFAIRPFVVKNKLGYRTGANLFVAVWVDWQSCGEIAREQGCPKARFRYWMFSGFAGSALLGTIISLYSVPLS